MGRPEHPPDSGRLIAALRDPRRYPPGAAGPADRVDLLETHISWVLLAGEFAYKVKKPVNLGFLDFSTLAARRFCCEEELRLNRRTAPGLYLGVVPVTGTAADPVLGGEGAPIEYAVKMRRFPPDALLDAMARNRALTAGHIEALAATVAAFHGGLHPAGPGRAYASPAQVLAAAKQNFDQIAAMAGPGHADPALDALREWTLSRHAMLAGAFAARKRDGWVRECHGDLHLGNIVVLEGAPVPFDCIEFNAAFRWIDVMNEIAFLVMDLEEHGLAALAALFLDRYLGHTGDYAGLQVLRFYIVYRALVRAKVARIRGAQPGSSGRFRTRARQDYARYLAFARGAAEGRRGALVIMHGLSGSGKSTVAAQLAETLRAIRLRSDVERKRLHGLAAQARTGSGQDAGIYSPAATERTYERLAELARHGVGAGYPVIVDAAFLAPRHRELMRRLARDAGVPFAIVACGAPAEVLRERVASRAALGTDASEAGTAVLERQLLAYQPLGPEEAAEVVEAGWPQGPAPEPGVADALARRLGELPTGARP